MSKAISHKRGGQSSETLRASDLPGCARQRWLRIFSLMCASTPPVPGRGFPLAAFLLFLMFAMPALAQDPPVGVLAEIGVDQKLNEQLPLDLEFRDEQGRPVKLRDYFRSKPVVLSLVYYECPMLCSMTLNGLTKSLRSMSFDVGREFDVLTISFDPKDTPEIAAAKKDVYLKDYGRAGAESGWHFLTGSRESIRRLTDAAGYRFKWDTYTNQWAHVSAIVVLTADGRLSQYLYGIEFSARDLRLSLVQASENKIGSLVDRVLLYCYHYDPATGRYGFVIMNVIRLAGCGTVFALAAFVIRNRKGGRA